MKAIYLYDTTSREFKGSKTIDDDNYVAQAGETEIKPVDGLYEPVTWDGSKWVGTDQEFGKQHRMQAYQEYLNGTSRSCTTANRRNSKQLAELLLEGNWASSIKALNCNN